MGFLRRKSDLGNPQKICVLFLRNLGIGDLVMLSPTIQAIADVFPQAEIDLVFWTEPIMNFKNIKTISLEEFKNNGIKYDLIISPTLNSRHLRFISRASHWFGYFAKPTVQANFPIGKYSYQIMGEHYLWRGIHLIQALNKEVGELLEKQALAKEIIYPELIMERPSYFDNLENEKYLVVAPVSKFNVKQWPLKNFSQIIQKLAMERKITKVVLLGDKSGHDRVFTNLLISNLLGNNQIFWKDVLIDVVGKNKLSETAFIIKNSYLFIGLDSAPAHFAYLIAKKVLTIFITVNPFLILPLIKLPGLVKCLCPTDPSFIKYYNGLVPVNVKKMRKYINSITIERVMNEISDFLNK
jgi:ADP-heptose:LPS heptosyltransferase